MKRSVASNLLDLQIADSLAVEVLDEALTVLKLDRLGLVDRGGSDRAMSRIDAIMGGWRPGRIHSELYSRRFRPCH